MNTFVSDDELWTFFESLCFLLKSRQEQNFHLKSAWYLQLVIFFNFWESQKKINSKFFANVYCTLTRMERVFIITNAICHFGLKCWKITEKENFYKAELPHPAYACVFRNALCFWSCVCFHWHKWTNVSTWKTQRYAENARVNGMCKCALSYAVAF